MKFTLIPLLLASLAVATPAAAEGSQSNVVEARHAASPPLKARLDSRGQWAHPVVCGTKAKSAGQGAGWKDGNGTSVSIDFNGLELCGNSKCLVDVLMSSPAPPREYTIQSTRWGWVTANFTYGTPEALAAGTRLVEQRFGLNCGWEWQNGESRVL